MNAPRNGAVNFLCAVDTGSGTQGPNSQQLYEVERNYLLQLVANSHSRLPMDRLLVMQVHTKGLLDVEPKYFIVLTSTNGHDMERKE